MATATIPTVPGVRPIVEIGVGTLFELEGTSMWQRTEPAVSPIESRWQDATVDGSDDATTSHWVGDEPLWLDVSCHCHEFSTTAGRERAIDEWAIGTATVIVENASGWADFPPPVIPEHPLLSVRPGRPIRVGVAFDGIEGPVYLWGGYIDATFPGYDPEVGETVTFECIDAKGEAGRSFIGAVTTPLGAGESASARVARILTAANWPSWLRDLDSTGVGLRGTTLGAAAVDLLNRAAESSGGAVFGDDRGYVVFRSRDNLVFDPAVGTGGTIGNFGDADVCPVSWELSFSREDISTRVVLARDSTTAPIVRDNVVARRVYGVETYERTDMETNLDVELGQIADRIRDVRSPAYMPRVAAVTLDASTESEAPWIMANANPYLPVRFTCRHRGDDGRTVLDRTMMVTGAEHTLSPDGWTARIALDDARPFMAIDVTRWQYDTGGVPPEARWEGEGTAINAPYARWMQEV